MHYYLNDVLPSPNTAGGPMYGITPNPRSSMPCTMNVQYQVKQAARKCTIFLCDLQRIMNDNKLFDRELYAECEKSLNNFRRLLNQFEIFKRVELEHKRGQFVTQEGKGKLIFIIKFPQN